MKRKVKPNIKRNGTNAHRIEPVTHFVDIYQRKEETLSPNSMQNRFSADFQFRIGKVHFLDDSIIASQTTFMDASSSGNIL